MTTRRRKSFLGRTSVLVVAFVSIIALTGIVYAHWFTTANIDGNVSTGSLGLWWADAGTNDDGWPYNDSSGSDCDDSFDEGCPGEAWDGNPPDAGDPDNPDDDFPGGAADPSEPGPGDVARYDKDVAHCNAWTDGGESLWFQVDNAYPSYHCTIEGQLANSGSIPVKTAGLYVGPESFWKDVFIGHFIPGTDEQWDGPVGWSEGDPEVDGDEFEFADFAPGAADDPDSWQPNGEFEEGQGEFVVEGRSDLAYLRPERVGDGHIELYDGEELEMNVWLDAACGVQIDPWYDDGGNTAMYSITVHPKNDADQGANYGMRVMPRAVNWNEFETLDPACGFIPYPD